MKPKIYEQYFFDCDGVILDSNNIKSDAFHKIAAQFSPAHADEFLHYHQTNGGISRFDKFKYFFSEMLKLNSYENELNQALKLFKEECVSALKICKVIEGVEDYLKTIPKDAEVYVVSGGAQEEVQDTLEHKGLARYFTSIHGSPVTKQVHMKNLRKDNKSAVFFGDSRLDFEVADAFNCDFVFMYGHTEFKAYADYFQNREIIIKKHFREYLDT